VTSTQPHAAEAQAEAIGQFTDAWNNGDIDAVMSFFADDCAYLASFGPHKDGTPYLGRDAVRAGVAAYMANFPDGRYEDLECFLVDPDRMASRWTFVGTSQETGQRVVIRGCDLFEFADGKIKTKDAFRKERSDPLPPVAER